MGFRWILNIFPFTNPYFTTALTARIGHVLAERPAETAPDPTLRRDWRGAWARRGWGSQMEGFTSQNLGFYMVKPVKTQWISPGSRCGMWLGHTLDIFWESPSLPFDLQMVSKRTWGYLPQIWGQDCPEKDVTTVLVTRSIIQLSGP